jgi:RNA polymerase sigma-70 factor (ECF subfamily)
MSEPTMDEADAELLIRARRGDLAAFAELAGRHRPALVRIASALLHDRDEAESVAQEALARALEGLPGTRDDLPFAPWLRGIALNLCRNLLRDRSRRARPTSPDRLAEEPSAEGRRRGVLSGILRGERRDRTAAAIDELPLPLREAFVLHFVEGLNYAEIGAMTGVAPGTLRVRAHRARTLLRHSLGPVVDTWMREARGGSSAS